ncbi:hypothetical protein HNY73_007663 [Argiope bruennichi]|uniref:Reverse transcriptase domain-containing protein n=1 Tax=Argiope bruennichi TaxID=94029 RepID=A0A8T0FFB0_ARGBR|nr:hypothetical protein HNY73_007663 [Argiope bruennichi]
MYKQTKDENILRQDFLLQLAVELAADFREAHEQPKGRTNTKRSMPKSITDSYQQKLEIKLELRLDKTVEYCRAKQIRIMSHYETPAIHSVNGRKKEIEHFAHRNKRGVKNIVNEVFSERKICGFAPKIENQHILENLRINKIELSDAFCNDDEIDLLLGADLIGKLLTGKCVQLNFGLAAIHTELGWTVIGKETRLGTSNDEIVVDSSVQTVLSLYVNDISLKELCQIDSLGIRDSIENVSKRKLFDEQLKEFREKLTVLPDGRYEMELPWKLDSSNLPDNKELASKRHEKIIKRARNDGYLYEYQKIFIEWENLIMIKRVPELELNKKCHYLPHRPVIKNSSQNTKIRPVFDASARENRKPSLNQCLFIGPNLIELLPDILDRFRMIPIGFFSVDIEKAFLQIGIAPHDRDYLRFFYPNNEIEIYRHSRVVFGVTSSPFILSASIEHLLDHVPHDFADVVQKLRHSFYVDNCLISVNNVTEEKHFIEAAQKVMSRACFNLRGWESNFPCGYMCKSSGVTCILGMLWDLDNDSLMCNINFKTSTCETRVTKRLILSLVQQIFDPIGILVSATLLPKLLLQET